VTTEAGASRAGSTETRPTQADKAARFLSLHQGPAPLLMPNPWDQGSARLLDSLGFEALATTSSGFAATLGRLDGSVSRDEALTHAASIVVATDRPVSADLENCFADDPAGVATTVGLAVETGLAGCSVEDFTRRPEAPIYDAGLAAERVTAAAGPAMPGRSTSSSRHVPRTTSTASPIWPTRSPGCRHTRRRAPTCCSPPA
jgi:2-methylisocitrate lyase-like PEP mutase family enzyme